MRDLTLKVTGMKCSGCVESVESALGAVPGVRSVEVSLEEETARLVLDDDVKEADLVAAVEGAGYGASAGG